ncbi:MAG TPA: aminotransferase class IV [Euzebyales bacterium]|nr:aminotransferase class IV [Euzebyales bacterium]
MVRPTALVNGVESPLDQASLAITDGGVQRGDGAFEAVGLWDAVPFRLDDHLARLDRSLAAIGLPPAPMEVLRKDIAQILDGQAGDGALRFYVTSTGSRIVSVTEPPVRTPLRRLRSQPAPWIRPLGTYGPASAKTMSYGPNMAASRAAERAGADDALLVSLEDVVLEGPTFAVMWVRDGRVHAPALELGLVDSISRRTVLEIATGAGIPHETGRYQLDDVLGADEVMTSSAVRPLVALEMIDGHRLPADAPVTARLAEGLVARRRGA